MKCKNRKERRKKSNYLSLIWFFAQKFEGIERKTISNSRET